jgi:hypothetical protein
MVLSSFCVWIQYIWSVSRFPGVFSLKILMGFYARKMAAMADPRGQIRDGTYSEISVTHVFMNENAVKIAIAILL